MAWLWRWSNMEIRMIDWLTLYGWAEEIKRKGGCLYPSEQNRSSAFCLSLIRKEPLAWDPLVGWLSGPSFPYSCSHMVVHPHLRCLEPHTYLFSPLPLILWLKAAQFSQGLFMYWDNYQLCLCPREPHSLLLCLPSSELIHTYLRILLFHFFLFL